MIKKIDIKKLQVGMYIQGLSRGEDGDTEHFMNTLKVNSADEATSFYKKGFRYAFVYFKDEIDVPEFLKDSVGFTDNLLEVEPRPAPALAPKPTPPALAPKPTPPAPAPKPAPPAPAPKPTPPAHAPKPAPPAPAPAPKPTPPALAPKPTPPAPAPKPTPSAPAPKPTPSASAPKPTPPAPAPKPTPPALKPTPPAPKPTPPAPKPTPPAPAPKPTPPAPAPKPTPPAPAPKPTPPALAPKPTPPALAPKPTPPAPKEEPSKKVLSQGLGEDVKVEIIDAWELPVVEELVSDETFRALSDEIKLDSDDEIVDLVPFEEELESSKKIKQEAYDMAHNLLCDVRAGKGVETSKAADVVGNIVDSVFNNQDALLSLSRLKDYDNYTFMHSVNVAILTIALGRQLRLSRDDLNLLGLGAMLHDVGKMLVPDKILNKSGTLTKTEFVEMRNHVTYGVDLLSQSKGITDKSIFVVLQHHERIDGNGYPNKVPGSEIDLFGKIGNICDVYDAMTTVRTYGDTPEPNEALKKIYGWKGQNFDPLIVDRFIMCLGIYPVGCIVELDTGEIGVVKETNRLDLLKPKVLIFVSSEKKKYFRPYMLDFSGDTEKEIVASLTRSVLPKGLDEFL